MYRHYVTLFVGASEFYLEHQSFYFRSFVVILEVLFVLMNLMNIDTLIWLWMTTEDSAKQAVSGSSPSASR